MLTDQSILPAPEDIVAVYENLVSSLCRRMIQDQETAKDAAQEVWLEIIKSLPTLRCCQADHFQSPEEASPILK